MSEAKNDESELNALLCADHEPDTICKGCGLEVDTMPKIVGFVLVLAALWMLMHTMQEVLADFSAYGATSKEIWVAIATIAGAGGLLVFVWHTLWG